MLRVATILGLVTLTACTSQRAERQTEAARERARPAVTEVIAREYPGASVTPLTGCVLDNATEEELVRLAQAALQGMSGRDTQMIRGMVRRPEIRTCAFDAGVTGYF